MSCVRPLAKLAVHGQLQIEGAGIWNFVRRDEPRPKHAVAVGRLPKAPVLRTPDGHIEADAVAGHVPQRLTPRDIPALPTNDDGQFDLMVGSPIRHTHGDAATRADERACRLQEQSGTLDRDGVRRVVRVDRAVDLHLVQVLLIVHRRRHELPRIRHWTQQRHAG